MERAVVVSEGANSAGRGEILKDRYEIVAVLGEGALGRTYLARDRARGGSEVAIKELLPSRMKRWKDFDLFHRECATLRSLTHKGIPRYEEDFTLEGAPTRLFLVQELVRGRSLADALDAGEVFEEAEVRRILERLLEIVHYLHTRSPPVIHRDIKPANIMLTPEGDVKLIDFGAVREAVTADGVGSTIVGTFGYMPPEQYAGQSVPATDLFAIGATCVQLLSGRPPAELFEGVHSLVIPEDLPVTLGFERVLMRLTEGEVTRRYQDAASALREVRARFLMIPRAAITGALPIPIALPPPPRRSPNFHLRDAYLGMSHLGVMTLSALGFLGTLILPVVLLVTWQLAWLVLALFLSVSAGAMMLPLWRSALADLEVYREGVYTIGEVTGRFLSDGASHLTYRFRVGEGFVHGSLATRDEAYRKLGVGDPLGVLHLSDAPERHIMYAVPSDWARRHALPWRGGRSMLTSERADPD